MSAAVQTVGTTSPSAADGWPLQTRLRIGLLGGAIAIYLCLVGIVPVFADAPAHRRRHLARPGVPAVTFGVVGFLAGRRARPTPGSRPSWPAPWRVRSPAPS